MIIDVRAGREGDLPALLEIYNHHVRTGHATFDEVEVSLDDRQAWWATYAPVGSHRLIVAAGDERVAGYATSSPYRAHPAFQHTVETSVYLAPDAIGQGIGGRLYDTLLAELVDTDAHHVVAAVALPNDASVALHLSRRFTVVGTFTDYAIKRGRRISSTWFERPVRMRDECP
ncbi:GNAT family N-acetyltransferase [Actinoplanes sp. NEAU-A12]|uniref:GNAT family N-acetyltransferase n=1 Tax=Actinoplanes sandaracinus TaxID=3045177 RepID=A0ABT6WKD5_9ACTN|nr:GNAT family N-acetyltransferase [Actinoplanes sandaracinus]MDI6100197.1 GNAT family N-acetyltransferase [Actinoplanes sandaracinus]